MSCGISEEVMKIACELSMKAHECCDESNEYLYEETMIDLALFPSLKSIGNQEAALANEAFLRRFKAIFENSSLSVEVDGAVKQGKQVVFAGHGLGGPMAIFATLLFLENYTTIDCIAAPRCVTFGSPLVGNRIFPA